MTPIGKKQIVCDAKIYISYNNTFSNTDVICILLTFTINRLSYMRIFLTVFDLLEQKKVYCGVHLDPMKQVSESTHIFLWKPFVMWVQNAPSLCLRWLASISIAITCSLWFLVPSLSSPFNSTQKQMQTWVTSTGDLRLKGQWATV